MNQSTLSDSPTGHQVLILHLRFVAWYALGFAILAALLHHPLMALTATAASLPLSTSAAVLEATSLHLPWWLGLVFAPLGPYAGSPLRRWAARRELVSAVPAQSPSELDGSPRARENMTADPS